MGIGLALGDVARLIKFRTAAKLCLVPLALGSAGIFAQDNNDTSAVASTRLQASDARPVFSIAIQRSTRVQTEFVGTYRPDGTFKRASKYNSYPHFCPARTSPQTGRPVEVPPAIDLHPIENVIQDYAPPAYARSSVRRESTMGGLRDQVITFVYGRQEVLLAPTHATTDSRQRLIISDPGAKAVHVLDGKKSFRIAGGPDRRLQHPEGVAVDSEDNIYVADSNKGLILVYNPEGHFVQYLGTYKGESMFDRPTAIGIDNKADRLYVLDSPANELVVLDLQGHLLKRVGGRRARGGEVQFDHPSELAVNTNSVVILDRFGSRIQVLNRKFDLQNSFDVRQLTGPSKFEEGLALDAAGQIYVTYPGSASLHVYRQNGELISSLKPKGLQNGELGDTSSMWIDPANRFYLVLNRQVHVFQLR